MSYVPSFESGNWKCECMICGCVFKGSEIRRRWDGMLVCPRDYEEKHSQLSVRGIIDDQRPPFTVPDAEDVFVTVDYSNVNIPTTPFGDVTPK